MFRREYVPPRTTSNEEMYETRAPLGVIVVRTILTAAGAAAIGIGAFLQWFRPDALAGTDMTVRAYYSPGALHETVNIFRSAGGVMIIVAALALIGLVFRSGWLTRLAGVLGLAGFAMMVITMFRAQNGGGFSAGDAIGPGLWLLLAGSIVTVIAGFTTGVRHVARTSTTAPGIDTTARSPVATPVATRGGVTSRTDVLQTDHECHVVRNDDGGWDVIGPGRTREVASFGSQNEAEARARDLLAMNGGGELVVHKRNGRIRGRETVAAA